MVDCTNVDLFSKRKTRERDVAVTLEELSLQRRIVDDLRSSTESRTLAEGERPLSAPGRLFNRRSVDVVLKMPCTNIAKTAHFSPVALYSAPPGLRA